MSLTQMPTDPKTSSFRHRLAGKIGPVQFNRLIESVADAKRAGRLRFWLERFFANLPLDLDADESEFLNTFGEYETFLYVFEDAERLTYTVSREEFIADPIKYFTDSKCDVPDEWIRDAWQLDGFRHDMSSAIAWTIALTDTLDETDALTSTLARVLPLDEAVALYESIRSELQMPELEWRHHFINAFPMVADSLPHPDAT